MSERSPAPSGGAFRFVGRERELALLLSAVRHPPAVVLVEGEAGIGKSRLVAEATAVLRRERRPVLTGFCHPLREPLPYGPVVDALGKAGPWLPDGGLPPTAGALTPLLPDLADRLPPPPAPTEDPRAERQRVIQAAWSFLDSLGETVLIIEDMHWVDEATRELLLLLARDLPPRLSLLLTHRTEGGTARRPVLGPAYRRPPGTGGAVIPLSRLNETDLRDLVADSLGAHVPPALAATLYARSEGLPLVAEEDLLTLAEHSRQHGFEGITRRLRDADVPRGLREAMTERLAALSPDAVAVVEAAAVLAVPATQELLGAVSRLDEDRAEQGLIEALDASVLQEVDGGCYMFRHALAQQVAYRAVPGPRRTRLHQRAVDELGRLSPQPLVQIAHHTHALGDRAAWLQAAEAAADQAIEVGDTGTAAALIGRILDEPDLDAGQRSRAALALAGFAAKGADPASHARRLRLILADPQLPSAVRGRIRGALGVLMINELADSTGAGELEKAVAEMGDDPEPVARAMIALALNERQGPDVGWAWLKRAEHAAEGSQNEVLQARIQVNRLTLLAYAGDPSLWPLMDALPRDADDPEIVRQTVRALLNVGDTATELGHDRRAVRLLTEGRELASRVGYPAAECYLYLALLRLDLLAGHWSGLEERFAQAVAAYPAMTLPKIEQALLLGQLSAARGQHALALEHFTTVAEEGERHTVSTALRAAGWLTVVHLARNAPGLAWASARQALVLLRESSTWPKATGLVPAAVEAALRCGDRAAAEQIVADAGRGVESRDTPAADAELQLARGLLLTDVEPGRASEHFAAAEAGWREIGRPYETARAAEHYAQVLAGADPAGAARPLADATAGYTELGATADLARVERLAHQLGMAGPTTVGRRGYGDRLSPRERQVAELLAGNSTNQQIAEVLFLSPRTVEHHVASVLRKLETTRKNVAAKLSEGEATG